MPRRLPVLWAASLPAAVGCSPEIPKQGDNNRSPSITMSAIAEHARFYDGVEIRFEGSISDPDQAADTLGLTAESDVAGPLSGAGTIDAAGTAQWTATLPEGVHSVTFTVRDAAGAEAIAAVPIEVGPPNLLPTCGFEAPADNAVSEAGAELIIEAEATDGDLPSNQLYATVVSDVDGPLFEGTPSSDGSIRIVTDALSTATHVLTLTVSDELGAECTSAQILTVNELPIVELRSPTDGDVVNESDEVSFRASVSDREDAPSALALRWTSDVDGDLSLDSADSSGETLFTRSDLTTGRHRIQLEATDSHGGTTIASMDLVINARPTAPEVSLTPDPARTADDLTAFPFDSVDPDDSGTITYEFGWYVDEVLSEASTSEVFPASATARGNTVRVVVTPSDGTGTGPTTAAEVVIENTPPVLSGLALSATSVRVGDILTCSATATDDDGDTPLLTYLWSDGSTGSTYTVTSADEPGDTITCTVTADDGNGGMDSDTTSALVLNSAPNIASVILDQSVVYTNDTLSATVSVSDADDDPLSITYTWYVDSTLVQSGSSQTLNGASSSTGFDRGESVSVTVQASDGTDSATASSSTLVVSNSAPAAPVIAISPSNPFVGDDLVCEVLTDSTDADGDSVTYSMSWTVDTVSYGGPQTTTWSDDTILGADTSATETWTCTAIPDDGTDTGASASDSVQVVEPCDYALSLDGINDYVTFGEPTGLDFARSSSYSIELWVNVQSYPSSAGQLYVYGDYESGRDNNAMGIYVSPAGLLILTNRGSSSNVSLVSSSTLSLDQWYHVHVQQESGVGTRLYLDGTLEASTSSTAGTLSFSASQEWTLGGRYYSYTDSYIQHLDGYLAEFRVWSDIRTSAEILAAAAFEPIDPTSEPHLAGMWSLDEGSGSTVYDLSGVSDDGTVISGGAASGTWTTACPTAP